MPSFGNLSRTKGLPGLGARGMKSSNARVAAALDQFKGGNATLATDAPAKPSPNKAGADSSAPAATDETMKKKTAAKKGPAKKAKAPKAKKPKAPKAKKPKAPKAKKAKAPKAAKKPKAKKARRVKIKSHTVSSASGSSPSSRNTPEIGILM